MNQAAQTLMPHLRQVVLAQADRQEAADRIAIGVNLPDAGTKALSGENRLPDIRRQPLSLLYFSLGKGQAMTPPSMTLTLVQPRPSRMRAAS